MKDSGHGLFHWNELLTNDVDKAKAFFSTAIGWTFEEMPMPDGQAYFVALKDNEPVGGLMAMPAEVPSGTPPHWLSYIEVDDVDKRVGQVRSAGGQVFREPFDVAEVGRIAIIADPTGAVLGIITPTLYDD